MSDNKFVYHIMTLFIEHLLSSYSHALTNLYNVSLCMHRSNKKTFHPRGNQMEYNISVVFCHLTPYTSQVTSYIIAKKCACVTDAEVYT